MAQINRTFIFSQFRKLEVQGQGGRLSPEASFVALQMTTLLLWPPGPSLCALGVCLDFLFRYQSGQMGSPLPVSCLVGRLSQGLVSKCRRILRS